MTAQIQHSSCKCMQISTHIFSVLVLAAAFCCLRCRWRFSVLRLLGGSDSRHFRIYYRFISLFIRSLLRFSVEKRMPKTIGNVLAVAKALQYRFVGRTYVNWRVLHGKRLFHFLLFFFFIEEASRTLICDLLNGMCSGATLNAFRPVQRGGGASPHIPLTPCHYSCHPCPLSPWHMQSSGIRMARVIQPRHCWRQMLHCPSSALCTIRVYYTTTRK